jgi:DNA mismatch endonuclease (patch repair protein)
MVFSAARLAVFLDGCFWHGCKQHFVPPKTNPDYWADKISGNRRRDRDTNRKLSAAGWTPLRVWEHEDPAAAAARIYAIVKRLGAR